MLNIDSKTLFGIKTDDQIINASRKVFTSIIGEDPFYIRDQNSEDFDEYANIKFDWINPGDKIVGTFLSREKKNMVCVIVLPPCSTETTLRTKFYLNFYEVAEERVIKCIRVLIYSGVHGCITGQGTPEEIAILERDLHQKTPSEVPILERDLNKNIPEEVAEAIKWFEMNKEIHNLVKGSVLPLAAARIIFKARNWF